MILQDLQIDELDALEGLRLDLHKQGKVHMLKNIKKREDAIQMTCPFHAGGHENRPSAGLLLKKKGGLDEGFFHCFACGYTADFFVFISNTFGIRDAGIHGRNWLLQNGYARKGLFFSIDKYKEEAQAGIVNLKEIGEELAERRRQISWQEHVNEIDGVDKRQYIDEEELKKYRVAHNYLYQRGISPEIIRKFDVGYDKENRDFRGYREECVTFPIKDDKGAFCIIRRAIKRKRFYIPHNIEKPIWGLYQVPADCDSVIICESIINALTCWSWGYYAIALLGTGTEKQMRQIQVRNWRHIYLAFDGDSAGRRATRRVCQNLYELGRSLYTYFIPLGKDVNDLTREEFETLRIAKYPMF